MLSIDSNLKCKLHNQQLNEENAPISYGYRRYSDEFVFAHTNFFPNSKFRVSGGCVIPVNSARFEKVHYCQECRDCHLEWAKEHNSNEGL